MSVCTAKGFRSLLTFMLILWLSGCTVVGFVADQMTVHDGAGGRAPGVFTEAGRKIDQAIVQALAKKPGEENAVENNEEACVGEGTVQICTANTGCWCEIAETEQVESE